MTPYLITLLCCVMYGGSEFLYKVAHDGELHEGTYLCVQSGVVFCALGLISAGGVGWQLTSATVALGVVSGAVAFVTAITMLISMGRGPASVTSAVRRLGFIVTGLLAVVFLGEQLTPGKLVGVGLAAGGLVVMAWSPHEAHRPYPLIYLTMITSGLLAFLHKLGADASVSPSAFLMLQAGTVHLSAHVWCRFTGGYQLTQRGIRLAPLTAVIIAVTMVAFMYALRGGEATVLVPLVQLSFLVTAPLSFRFLREPVHPRKLFGLAMGATAVLVFGLLV